MVFYRTCLSALLDKRLTFIISLLALSVLTADTLSADSLPDKIPILGGSKAFMPSLINSKMLFGSILMGFITGVVTGVIGVGGGHILTPALMSFGVRGIMAVGTDQYHLFAKAIMGTTIHRKLGNVKFALAAWFVAGSLSGVTLGGYLNRAIFQYNPALSDALISSVYVVVLGILGFYAIADWVKLRQAKNNKDNIRAESTTRFAKKLQKLTLLPQITFDRDIVPGGRRIPVYPVIICGLIVGFVAAIMGVGGGFLTFPMFVYGIGVSTFTTIGTDILQIIFTTCYSSIFQYAIYGFMFYTVAIGMLSGALFGVQFGALVTTMVKGIQIRAFYALTILAGFSNRLCALPRKLADLGYVSLSRNLTVAIETIGIATFFVIVGVFALWVIIVFFKNIGTIVAHRGRKGVTHPKKFFLGVGGLIIFFTILIAGFSPIIQDKSMFVRADGIFNQIAKHSAYYIPAGQKKADKFKGEFTDLGIRPREFADEKKLLSLATFNKMEATVTTDGRLRIKGDLGNLALSALSDAELAFRNENESLESKYHISGNEVIYCWWVIFDGLTRRYVQENKGSEANFTKFVSTKILEPAYNFRGIEARRAREYIAPVTILLAFYILYTLWYGFSIIFLSEGIGIAGHKKAEKREI